MNNCNDYLYILPDKLRMAVFGLLSDNLSDKEILSEIRIRINQNPHIITGRNHEIIIDDYTADRDMINHILTAATRYSMYAYQDTIRQGFISLRGGHRLGVLGHAVVNNGHLSGQRNISYLNLRIAHECIGCSDSLMDFIDDDCNVLVISPPACGKTTLLRDIARNFSYGFGCRPSKVTIVDERGEIAACVDGIPQNDIGPRTDVCDMGNKSESVFAALRSMSPQIIIMDEIGGSADIEAVKNAVYAGVKVIASIHSYNHRECMKRADINELLNACAFGKIIVLSGKNGAGTVEELINLHTAAAAKT